MTGKHKRAMGICNGQCGNPDPQPLVGDDLCRKCYQADYRQKERERLIEDFAASPDAMNPVEQIVIGAAIMGWAKGGTSVLKHQHLPFAVGAKVLELMATMREMANLFTEDKTEAADEGAEVHAIPGDIPAADPAIQREVEQQIPKAEQPKPANDIPLVYIPNAISYADRLFAALLMKMPWKRYTYQIKGKSGPVPREEVWVGATGYHYGGRYYPGWNEPGGHGWTQELGEIKRLVEKLTQTTYDAVLCNLYRTERDACSQHCDCEPTMSDSHPIASVSLGATRRFRVRRSKEKDSKQGVGPWRTIDLEHASLAIMAPGMQHDWVHEVPREKHKCEPRINLTFRVYEEAR